MKYSDQQRLQKIHENTAKLLQYISENHVQREALLSDYSLQWLVTTPLYNIGEHVYYMSDEFKENHPDIPWGMISGLRHRLVHDYDGTNWNIIVEVVFDELPSFLSQIEKLMETQTSQTT